MMQIREVVLYGYNKKVRRLSFSLGKVNIITGNSKSGKSVIGDIIEYCLGGDSCNIAEGVVREYVDWYGLLLQFENERVFVARKNPEKGNQTSYYCYIEIGENIESPEKCNFVSNTNVSGIEESLSRRIGILENKNIPVEGQSRKPLSANIRHALYYCFQGQDEIAARNNLFHRQSESFITQSIKDTIPYFLGVVDEEALSLENERSILKRNLILEKRKVEEKQFLFGSGFKRAIELIGEAKEVGLIAPTENVNYENFDAVYSILKETLNWIPCKISENRTMDRLTSLQDERYKLKNELDNISLNISNTKKFIGNTSGYSNEVKHQINRLESIGLFEKLNFEPGKCPFCSGNLKFPNPSIEMMKKSIDNLDKSIKNVSREKPKLDSYISNLEKKRSEYQSKIKDLESEIDGLYNQNKELNKMKDINASRAKVIGRISLWIESVKIDDEDDKTKNKINELEKRINKIDEKLSKNSMNERKLSILSIIQNDMTNWASQLKLENSNFPYRLDLNKVTVMVDKVDRSVPLKQLGSGSNWVGIHLISYFALHKFFITAKRPVPCFLFLDQPSQVYFPSESNINTTDMQEVSNIYKFINDRTNELDGKLQVIIVDHANLEDKSFKDNICENWHDKNSEFNTLIPNDWFE